MHMTSFGGIVIVKEQTTTRHCESVLALYDHRD